MKICIFGAASDHIKDVYKQKAYELSKLLAKEGHSLVFGAGSSGIMGACARGFTDGGGKTYGVIPYFFEENGFEKIFFSATELIRTKTMAERKERMENMCDAFIVAPGGIGTLEEFFEALTLKQLGRHKKAIVVFNVDGYYENVEKHFDKTVNEGFVNEESRKLFVVLDTPEEIVEYLKKYSPDDIVWNILKK